MKLAIVAYPRLDERDRQLIEAFRATHDPQASRIAAHFTLVFPVDATPDDIAPEIAAVARSAEPIAFAIDRVAAVPDAVGQGSHIFLVPNDGAAQITTLHDRLYGGVLRAHLRLDIPFIPHVTVGVASDAETADELAKQIDVAGRAVRGTISSIDLVAVGPPRVESMTSHTLGNPWLGIPVDDYVGHMASPNVGQRQVLNRLFGDAVRVARPQRALVLGGSIGNGLEHVDPVVTSRVVVVDINPEYLRRLHERFPNPGFELDARSCDVMGMLLEPEAYDLVHAGLIFEYVNWPELLPRLARALKPGGVLSVILQSPSASSPAVTPSPFTSLRRLEALFQFVEPAALVDAARGDGLTRTARHTEALPAGKTFEVFQFTKDCRQE